MLLIGHNYIPYKVLGRMNTNTFLGSYIPDLVPFLPSSVFSFEEIHETDESFLEYVRKNDPEMEDLALSMMCHSVKYGADEYNKYIDGWLVKSNEELKDKIARLIMDASDVTEEMARGPRMHNYLWAGLDVYLINTNPDGFIDELASVIENKTYDKVAKVLAGYFKKNPDKVIKNLEDHFSYINPDTVKSTRGMTLYVRDMFLSLAEGDRLDLEKGALAADTIYEMFMDEWPEVLTRVENGGRDKMERYI